jgi:hypothetical protein
LVGPLKNGKNEQKEGSGRYELKYHCDFARAKEELTYDSFDDFLSHLSAMSDYRKRLIQIGMKVVQRMKRRQKIERCSCSYSTRRLIPAQEVSIN